MLLVGYGLGISRAGRECSSTARYSVGPMHALPTSQGLPACSVGQAVRVKDCQEMPSRLVLAPERWPMD